jgi:hydrogenase/urease accessory protein HupE
LAGLDDVGLPPGIFDGLLDPLEGVDDLLQMVASLAKQATVG